MARVSLSAGREASEGLRVLLGRPFRTPGAVVLAYHDVTPASATSYQVTPARFRMHLEMLRAWGAKVVDLAALVENWGAGRSVDGQVAVVFDDALDGVLRYASPIMHELGMTGTVFAISQRFDQVPEWWPGANSVISEVGLRELVDAGFDVAAHSQTHRSLPSLSDAEQRTEIAGSRADLEGLLGRSVDLFAYPFGHYDERAVAAVDEAGYQAAFTFLNGRVQAGLDRLRLPRLNMWQGQSRARLAYHLARSAESWGNVQPGQVAAHHEGLDLTP